MEWQAAHTCLYTSYPRLHQTVLHCYTALNCTETVLCLHCTTLHYTATVLWNALHRFSALDYTTSLQLPLYLMDLWSRLSTAPAWDQGREGACKVRSAFTSWWVFGICVDFPFYRPGPTCSRHPGVLHLLEQRPPEPHHHDPSQSSWDDQW